MIPSDKFLLFSFFFLFMCFDIAEAQNIINAGTLNKPLIGRQIEYYIDTTNDLPIEQIELKAFNPCKNDILNLGIIPFTVWIRFMVSSEKEGNRYLEIANPYIESLELYRVEGNNKSRIYSGGFTKEFSNRPVKVETWLFNIYMPAHRVVTYYIKSKTGFNFQLPIAIYSKDKFVEVNQYHNLFWGAYCGTMIFAIIYNLFIYFSVREKRYFYYICYVLGSALFYLSITGFTYEFLWPEYPIFNSYSVILICFTNIMVALFYRVFP